MAFSLPFAPISFYTEDPTPFLISRNLYGVDHCIGILVKKTEAPDAIVRMSSQGDTNLARAALAIALVALLTTIGQLLQQYLATADGYRRCQSSVMGPWAKRTRLKWRWRQFRFETLFTTPTIGIGEFPGRVNDTRCFLTGTSHSFALSMIPENDIELVDAGGELASWVPFLYAAHRYHYMAVPRIGIHSSSQSLEAPSDLIVHESQRGRSLKLPYVTFDERSWDFVSPEIVKPYSRISVHAVAVMARRVGMLWSTFDPVNGIMRAEGNGYYITSTTLRSIGTLLHFSWHKASLGPNKEREEEDSEAFIPNQFADTMGFGILPCIFYIGSPCLRVGTEADVVEAITTISNGRLGGSELRGFVESYSPRTWIPGFSELIPLSAPLIEEQFHLPVLGVPAPSKWSFGPTTWPRALAAFHRCLRARTQMQDDETMSKQLQWVLEASDPALESPEVGPQATVRCERSELLAGYLSKCYDTWQKTSAYFFDFQLSDRYSGGSNFYRNLLYSHVTQIIMHYEETRYDYIISEGSVSDTAESVFPIYFRCLPYIIEDMKAKGLDYPDVVAEAWFTLLLRAWCWNQLHHLMPGKTVPSQYHNSALPVFIA